MDEVRLWFINYDSRTNPRNVFDICKASIPTKDLMISGILTAIPSVRWAHHKLQECLVSDTIGKPLAPIRAFAPK